ncbi:Uncharacterised protein [Mycobacterium tuberculosis]|nr:Uncharacterised protein [Mycobacterium tuberculosis]
MRRLPGGVRLDAPLAVARALCRTVLPRLASDGAITEATTLDVKDLPEESF